SSLARAGAFKPLDGFQGKEAEALYYPVAYQSGLYKGQSFALPLESNPIMMCVNQDLLEQEGLAIPETAWTLEDLYRLCQKLTKDTNGDGIIDQFGITDYSWQQALVAYGGQLKSQT
ncbi:extracellular solute-binding protein, partial [Streptococcus danieliae]|nr:extracellular solute-binding protein [Streptococcus danieliae]